MKFNLWINSNTGTAKLFELDKGWGMYPSGIHPMQDDYIGTIDLLIEKPKKIVIHERPIPDKNVSRVENNGEALFYVPANAKNLKCTYEIEENNGINYPQSKHKANDC